ncbi:DISARM system SNF2-like helicase DrmD [Paraliomyxa miuraensis]|uniref:DISARM system SNF2-like helicase DrmD n=1 Tax=Paraliomyxa miuraensis TaxID=376150 RepID=UPI002256B4B4|nr:DISARM system SNF2-like helicase DrmD [Paraliomyxa miuraensis]MCX4242546.1 DISARM system SNF2-like helicase DrmD [Paraliomyxa miuraensis]
MALQAGQIVRVRSRQYLVEEVVAPPRHGHDTLVRLSCLADDAQGEPLEVLWEREVDAKVLGATPWDVIARRGFDDPTLFSAYLHTLRWNCVTSTKAELFQAPYRAGIEVKAYQLEPLRRALRMPRVNLFIADDVGLGKTIEAGLILREMLMRQKVRRVVVACPPSVVLQWQAEMEQRFGLTFVVFDRELVARMRRERGYGVNPWKTHTRFVISHALLRNEDYASTLRAWLGTFCPGTLLILDEAHNAAPASGGKGGGSQLTHVVRDLARRFEHRLFLSATPHNGHSNSFAALLEMLDPQRFCRGLPVGGNPKLLDAVMVRRLKADLRRVESGFPERRVVPVVIDGLPEDAPELRLSALLQAYREARTERLAAAAKSRKQAALLVITSLQKRLLSSVEAFSRTLRVHRKAMERRAEKASEADAGLTEEEATLLHEPPGADDERAERPEDEVEAEDDAAVEAATRHGARELPPSAEELRLLEEMTEIAERARYDVDHRLRALLGWLREHVCAGIGEPGRPAKAGAAWEDRRVLIFTEYTDTKRWLEQQLQAAIAGTDRAEQRVGTFHGGMGDERREEIKRAFNADPGAHPLRILIATDAAREGVNLQNHCADLFHMDVPWNPSRMEQRNGRIDRKLQRAEVVQCHYFVLPQRAEDRVLDVLVKKTDTIQRELGSLSPVLVRNVERLLSPGIGHDQAGTLAAEIERAEEVDEGSRRAKQTIEEELDPVRRRDLALQRQVDELRGLLRESQQWLGLDDRCFRDAISASLAVLGAEPLRPEDPSAAAEDPARARWVVPALDQRAGADPTWATTLDTLRAPRERGEDAWQWRRRAGIRPVVFRDPGTLDDGVVHLHLEHRVAQRLLGRFLAQGFVSDDLSRACVLHGDDPIPRVILLGRLSLYGPGAARLHDEVLSVTARWVPGDVREEPLAADEEGERVDVLRRLDESLGSARLRDVPEGTRRRLSAGAAKDVAELLPALDREAKRLAKAAKNELVKRGKREAKEMEAILRDQQTRIEQELREPEPIKETQLALGFESEEGRQRAADRRHWEKRLGELEKELDTEPARVRAGYEVKAVRMDPVGVVYLWPVSS